MQINGFESSMSKLDPSKIRYSWVEDCWSPSYRGAPNDGSARRQ